MKKLLKFCVFTLLIFGACKTEKNQKNILNEEPKYEFFGNEISMSETLLATEAFDKMKDLQVGDTINLKFASTIKEVCTKKGCWMKLPLKDSIETMVNFKDYGFFMPLDSKGKEVIVTGKAFVKKTSVKDLKHYAKDAGKSAQEIAEITEPKKEFSFIASGVLMKVN